MLSISSGKLKRYLDIVLRLTHPHKVENPKNMNFVMELWLRLRNVSIILICNFGDVSSSEINTYTSCLTIHLRSRDREAYLHADIFLRSITPVSLDQFQPNFKGMKVEHEL